jgi:hypothetical protein
MPEWQRRLHKISLVAFFGTACWAMKICTQVYQAWILLANDGKFPGRWWWAVMLCSFFFEELFTSACILLILRKRHSSDADGNMSGVYNAGSMLSLARADTYALCWFVRMQAFKLSCLPCAGLAALTRRLPSCSQTTKPHR